MRNTRPIVWLRARRRDFEDFPEKARDRPLDALTVAAEGGTPAIAKPLRGFGSGVLELALAFRGDAFRVVYAVQLGADLWVHALQKKSKTRIRTPKQEIELIEARFRRVKEMVQ